MKLKIFSVNLAGINSYLLYKEKNLVIIDPGFNAQAILDFIIENDLKLEHVFLTHGHFDHIKGVETLAKHHDFSVYIGEEDKPLLDCHEKNYAKAFGSGFKTPGNVNVLPIKDGENIKLFDESFAILSTPGHTKGSICIKHNQSLFTGDTLFYDSVGRTDLYSGNMSDLKGSLNKLLKTTSNQTMIYPGHGGYGKLKTIKEINPYL